MSPDIAPCPRPADRALIACVYARKSTKQSDVNDVEKSVTRQITLAKAFAAEKKWDVIETYIDDEVSGQEYARLVNRARLLADATAGKFGAVIVATTTGSPATTARDRRSCTCWPTRACRSGSI